MGKPYNGFIILFIILDSSMFFIIFCTFHNLAQWGSYRNWWIIPLWDLAQVKEVHLSTVSWFFLPGETWHASNVGIGKLNSFFAIFMIGTPISQKPNHGKKKYVGRLFCPFPELLPGVVLCASKPIQWWRERFGAGYPYSGSQVLQMEFPHWPKYELTIPDIS